MAAILIEMKNAHLIVGGCFLAKHHVYQNAQSERIVLSLGFRTCAALGLRMVKTELNGQVALS